MNADNKELISVLLTMGILLILALIAVALFIRQWRKEHNQSPKSKVQSPKSKTRA
jgi:hypothetical protein